jgi:5-methylcytosine-specific restriction protein A
VRNPDWTRDELILALDLYFRHGRKQLDARHPDVVALSATLSRLPVHGQELRAAAFRNPNGVAMKLGNFTAVDPSYDGQGLERGGRLERTVWADFAEAPSQLKAAAEAIHDGLQSPDAQLPLGFTEEGEEEEFPEGRILTRLHLARERSAQVVRRKKDAVLAASGRLACECCGFDFDARYGVLGRGFAECHHLLPLAELREARRTRLTDLAIVCANCHRMLHRARPPITVAALRCVIETEIGRASSPA